VQDTLITRSTSRAGTPGVGQAALGHRPGQRDRVFPVDLGGGGQRAAGAQLVDGQDAVASIDQSVVEQAQRRRQLSRRQRQQLAQRPLDAVLIEDVRGHRGCCLDDGGRNRVHDRRQRKSIPED
jgi:hypothetical protein